MKFLMGLLAALFMIGTAQAGKSGGTGFVITQDAADSKSYFWNQKVGNSMTMQNSFETEAGTVNGASLKIDITKNADGVCTLSIGSGGHSQETYMGSKDGYFCWGTLANGKFEAKMRMFKYGAKAGDTWDGWAAKEEGQSEVTVKYVGLEEVKVTAGTYKDVAHVNVAVKDGPTLDYYFAAKMGMIKFTMSQDGKVARTLEMTAFTEAK